MNRFGSILAIAASIACYDASAETSRFSMKCSVTNNYDGGLKWSMYKQGTVFWLKGILDDENHENDNSLDIHAPGTNVWRSPFQKAYLLDEYVIGVAEYEYKFSIERSTGNLLIEEFDTIDGKNYVFPVVDATCERTTEQPAANVNVI